MERLREASEIQDAITARKRRELVGTVTRVLIDRPGVARSHREAPEIDGIIEIDDRLLPGSFVDATIVDAVGPDLIARPTTQGAGEEDENL
jgi:tRNA A37 methylthiotransferase MiaB